VTKSSESAAAAAVVIGALALVVLFYRDTIAALIEVWNLDPNYSHGFMVPVASAIFAGQAWLNHGPPLRRQVPRLAVIKGLAEIALGLLLHVVGWLVANLFVDVLSLICVLRGLLLMLGGSEANKEYGFSALFLIFMAPLPAVWYQPIAIAMQQLVSWISTGFLDLCGVPVYREGYLIQLPGFTMEVGEACSGLRQMTAVLALAVALGHLAKKGTAYTWTLALLSLPIAIFANSVRVLGTGLILIWFGPKWAEGVYHTLEGMVIVGLAAVLVVATAWALGKMNVWRLERDDGPGTRNGSRNL